MAKTLLTRISKLEQYNIANKTVLWEDPTESRWVNVYGQLEPNDKAIFIAVDKLLIGTVGQVNNRQSILCNNIEEVICSNDQFLQLHEIYPELISRVKANFQPFIHPQTINITQLIADANSKQFVSYYIVSGIAKYDQFSFSLKINDRIILLNTTNKFINVKLHSATGLIDFIPTLNIGISVEGLTLDEVLEKNKSIKRKSAKSNNVNRIQNIKTTLAESGIYKFNTFFSYYDALYNKRVYGEGSHTGSLINRIKLKANESVFKISMSGKDISLDSFNHFVENNLLVVHSETPAKGTSYQTQGDTFAKQMKIGDYFYLCRGNNNLEVIGKISSETAKCEHDDFGVKGWLQRSYEIIEEAIREDSYQDVKKWWTPNDNSTCIVIPKHEINEANTHLFVPFFNTLFEYEENVSTNTNSTLPMDKSLNQILYGPPGTGKTYNTINKALEIIDEEEEKNLNWIDRENVKSLFDKRLDEGRIVFTTFHQSMSYEDFIEGIKPIEPEKEGDPVIYRVELGILRNLCIEAAFAIAQLRESKTTEEVLDFSILYDNFAEGIDEKILNGQKVELETKTGGTVLVESISQQGNFIIKHHDGTRTYTVSKARLTKLQYAIKNLDDISNINNQFREIIGGSNSSAYWSVLNAIRNVKPTKIIDKEKRNFTFEEKKEVVLSLSKSDYKNKNGKPFVLIIDEINRGNVSQIFGELITLIECDKRLGRNEALEVTLPYSKDKFGVPSNLSIVGTMNTADRSVEALDTALRRRFSFVEILPNYELEELNYMIAGHKASSILKTMNSRIEKLLDKDHAIGHSYFIKNEEESPTEKLIYSFYHNIIPLLKEYFFGDFGKIGLVLGNGFVRKTEWNKDTDSFADFDYESASEFEEREIYEIIDFRNTPKTLINIRSKGEVEVTFEKAIKLLMKDNIE